MIRNNHSTSDIELEIDSYWRKRNSTQWRIF